MSEGDQDIVITAIREIEVNSSFEPSFALNALFNSVSPIATSDPFSGKGGEATIKVGKLNVKAKTFSIDGFTFKINISEADWNRMSEEQKGAVTKIVNEFSQSPAFKELLDYFQSHGVRNIILHFDGNRYNADGGFIDSFSTDRLNPQHDYGFVAYKRELNGDDTDIAAGTDVHVSLNPRVNQSSNTLAKSFLHELYHPFEEGVEFDEDRVDAQAQKAFNEIFKNKRSGLLENDELAYAATQTVIGSFSGDVIAGGVGHDTLSGKEGADHIHGGEGNDHIIGGDGMDVLTTGSGEDFVSGGLDADRFVISAGNVRAIVREESGVDTIDTGMTYAGATFSRVGNSLFIQQDGRTIQVNGQWVSPGNRVEKFNFTDGSYAASVIEARADPGSGSICYVNGRPVICSGGFGTPVVLDLDGDGLDMIEKGNSRVDMDVDGDGVAERIGWVGGDDGLLVLDRNGDGRVNGYGEISFLGDYAGAGSDLEGLYGFDSNEDGFLSASDDRFSDFLIWRTSTAMGSRASRSCSRSKSSASRRSTWRS